MKVLLPAFLFVILGTCGAQAAPWHHRVSHKAITREISSFCHGPIFSALPAGAKIDIRGPKSFAIHCTCTGDSTTPVCRPVEM